MNTRCCAALVAATMLLSPCMACAQDTTPLAASTQAAQEAAQRLDVFRPGRAYMGVRTSSRWMYQARLSGRLLDLRLFTADGVQRTFKESLRAADTGEGDIRLELLASLTGEKLVLQLDQDALDALCALNITEIAVAELDRSVQASYLVADLAALREAFGVGAQEQLCVSGESDLVTVVSVDGIRRQITE